APTRFKGDSLVAADGLFGYQPGRLGLAPEVGRERLLSHADHLTAPADVKIRELGGIESKFVPRRKRPTEKGPGVFGLAGVMELRRRLDVGVEAAVVGLAQRGIHRLREQDDGSGVVERGRSGAGHCGRRWCLREG